jgi:hypothetical protein
MVTTAQATEGKLSAGSGYWVAIGCLGSILLANTPVAPFALGIIGVALIYQTNLLLQGK